MAHSSELRWGDVAGQISGAATQTLRTLLDSERVYQELLEAYNYAGGTDQAMADMLFQDINGNPSPITNTGTTEQVAMVTDLRLAIQALHTLYEAGNNVAVAQEDRFAALRRMS